MMLLFICALVPRALGVGEFVTVDEGVHWFERARLFLEAIQSGNAPATMQTGHPGVTTMWLGASGRLLAGTLGVHEHIAQMQLMRLPVAIVTSLCISLAYLPLRRLFGTRLALLAALLWAGDPFMIAHSQLLHVDALLASFMTLAILCGLLALGVDRLPEPSGVRWLWLAGSGLSAGLALLTKSPAVVLIPGFAALVVVVLWQRYPGDAPLRRARQIAPGALGIMLVWMALVAALWFGLWPAARVDPLGTLIRIVTEAEDNGGTPHGTGSFFLGVQVADPGPLFYPLALTLRLTPWVTIGILAALGVLHSWRADQPKRFAFVVLAAYVIGFVLALTLMAKKFDRYALPVVPALQILAAAGLFWLADACIPWPSARRHLQTALAAALSIGAAATTLAYHPYELAYYNPLLGGGKTAQQVVPVGWGEGYELAARYVASRPDGCSAATVVWYRALAENQLCGPTVRMSEFDRQDVGYMLVYIDQLQRGYYAEALQGVRGVLTPVTTITIGGIEYAQVYAMPHPVQYQTNVRFGDDLRLWGYDVDVGQLHQNGVLTVTLEWQALADMKAQDTVFVHVLNGSGEKVGQVDVSLGGTPGQSVAKQHFLTQTEPIAVPHLRHGDQFWVVVGVYDPATTRREPLSARAMPAVPASGPNSLTLGMVKPGELPFLSAVRQATRDALLRRRLAQTPPSAPPIRARAPTFVPVGSVLCAAQNCSSAR